MLQARKQGTCKTCNGVIAVGEQMEGKAGEGWNHIECWNTAHKVSLIVPMASCAIEQPAEVKTIKYVAKEICTCKGDETKRLAGTCREHEPF